MKHKMRKFAEGGDFETDAPDIEAPEEKASADDLSFSDAFDVARKAGDKTFTWRGKQYNTRLGKGKSSSDSEGDSGTSGGPTSRNSPRMQSIEITAKRERKGPSLADIDDRSTGFRKRVAETGMSPDERAEAMKKVAMGAAATLLPGAALRRAGAGAAGSFSARGFGLAERERAAAAAADYAQRMQRLKETATARAGMSRGSVYKKGGSVKKYAKGGGVSSASKRADGIASKGKTRGKFV